MWTPERFAGSMLIWSLTSCRALRVGSPGAIPRNGDVVSGVFLDSERKDPDPPVSKQFGIQCLLAVSGAGIALVGFPAVAEMILPGRCHMGWCYEMSIKDKRPLTKTSSGTLYEIRRAGRSWKMGTPKDYKSIPFGDYSILYAHCSTRRPAIIFKQDVTTYDYRATLLNPNGRDNFGYNMAAYHMYWGVCHGVIDDFWSEEMVSKSIALGYPGNLEQEQIEIRHPLDIDR